MSKASQSLSHDLETWLNNRSPKTFDHLFETFSEKSFAVALMLLLFPSALPLPTGGVTNAFEIIAMGLSAQLIVGRTTMWLPKRWATVEVGTYTKRTVMPKLIRLLTRAERYSRHNLSAFLNMKHSMKAIGICMFMFALAAFVAPPFTGLDTLPSLAVVLVAIAVLVEDVTILVVGIVTGTIGSCIVAWSWPTLLSMLFLFGHSLNELFAP